MPRDPGLGMEVDTFTVVARCNKTNALGICLATSPLAVASRCPHIIGGLAAVSSQCHTNPRLGILALDLIKHGFSPEQAIGAISQLDQWFEYRQIGIVTQMGGVAVHSGKYGKPYTGHLTGEGFVCMGNGLAGRNVLEAMATAYRASADEAFEERLVRTIEAGRDAGGQPKGQLSAGLLVAEPGMRPRTDLRVDMAKPTPQEGGDAVTDLRRVFDAYKRLITYYASFWPDHPQIDREEWLRRNP